MGGLQRSPKTMFTAAYIAFIIAVLSVASFIAIAPLKISSKWPLRLLSLLFTLFLIGCVFATTDHMCDEGDAPLFLMLASSLSASIFPLLFATRPWLCYGSVAFIAFSSFCASAYLTASYHRDDVTGNPRYASGRFWHTPFTGQMPRAANQTSGEQGVAPNP